MKKILVVCLTFSLLIVAARASVNSYTFFSSTGTYTAISGGVVLGTTANNNQVFNNNTAGQPPPQTNTGFPIGFSFLYNGVVYDKFAVNTNGWILLGTGSFTIAGTYTPISALGPSGFVSAISALGMDLQGQTGSELSYLTSGTAPNRVLTIQWTGYRYFNSTGDSFDFQIRLYETTNQVSFVYGSFAKNAAFRTPQVGLRGFTNEDFHNRTTTTNWNGTSQGGVNTETCLLTASVLPQSGLDFSFNPLPAVPDCAGVVYPPDLAAPVMVTASLSWSAPAGGGSPAGYKLYFGTDNPPTNLVNGTDLGLVTTYDPSPDMNLLTPYYWKIVPANGYGDATGCPVWSFTTGPDPTITTFPHCESFDGTFEPYGWINMKTAGPEVQGQWFQESIGFNPSCLPRSGSAMTTYHCRYLPQGTAGILVTPPVNFPNDQYMVTFWMYRDDGYPTRRDSLNVFLNTTPGLSGATLMGTIKRVRTLDPPENTNGWYQYVFNLPAGGGGAGKYVIFEAVSMNGNNIFLDDVCLDAISYDFGDAVYPAYPTLLVHDGARHLIAGLLLGNLIDNEPDGLPHLFAAGDDLNNLSDEDGISVTGNLQVGSATSVLVTASGPGFLNAWADFNLNFSWADPGEQIFTNTPLVTGVNNLSITTPPNALTGNTFLRFRFSTQQNLSFTGPAVNGEVEDYQVVIDPPPTDFGDAPDPMYPTLSSSNGACHMFIAGITLGLKLDREVDGQPDPAAKGDDNFSPSGDDEDGITFNTPFVPGQVVQMTVSAPNLTGGYLQGWIDYDANGSWNDPGEQIFTNLQLNNASTILVTTVPAGALQGNTFARFRYSTVQNLAPTGTAPDGEVEDYLITIQTSAPGDFGDAPDPGYPTLLQSNGPYHALSQIFIGTMIDIEQDGQPDANARGDDYNPPGAANDEDGISFGSFIPGQQVQVVVSVSQPGFLLQGWLDLNADGDWLDPGEQIFINQVMVTPAMNLFFPVPGNATLGYTFARFRYSSASNLAPTGMAPDGEVQDYQVYIGNPPAGNLVDPDPVQSYIHNEISMALVQGTQPGSPAVLLAAYNDDPVSGGPGLGVSVTADGGATWIIQQLPYPSDPFSGGSFTESFDPTATADAGGNLYVAHISTDSQWATGPASGLFVHKSADGGVTWTGPYTVATDPPPSINPSLYRLNDRCQIIADVSSSSPFINNIYIVEIKDRGWKMPQPWGDIYFSYSTNGGITWSTQIILNGLQSNMANMPVPAVAPDGTIYVSWLEYNCQTGGAGIIYLDKSTNGGVTWLTNDIFVRQIMVPPLNLNGTSDVRAKGAPVICVSPFNSQEIYMTYAEKSLLTPDEGDIFFIRSVDGGLTWSTPIRVNNDFTVNDQVMPWMAVKPNGIIDISWYDRRNDPADMMWDVYMGISYDGGLSFPVNMMVNNTPAAPSPSTSQGIWMGEYLGLVADNSFAYVTYTSAISDIKGDIYFNKVLNPGTTKTLNLKIFLEGLYVGAGLMNKAQDQYGNHFPGNTADEVLIELHDAVSYATVYYTIANVSLTTGGNITVSGIPGTYNANYYLSVKHRNSIETATAAPLSFASSTISYDFTTTASKAYGSNLKLTADGNFLFWGGDVNQDGIVDGSDMNFVDNAVTAITFGYVPEDVNGDGIVDGTDMNMVDNNSTAIIMAILPP